MTPLITQVVDERDRLKAEATVLRRDLALHKSRVSVLENHVSNLIEICRSHGIPVSSTDLIHGAPPMTRSTTHA